MVGKESVERGLLEGIHIRLTDRGGGRGSRLVIDEGQLTEAFTWLHNGQYLGSSLDRLLRDRDVAAGEEEKTPTGIALPNDHLSVLVEDPGRKLKHGFSFGNAKPFEQGDVKSFETQTTSRDRKEPTLQVGHL